MVRFEDYEKAWKKCGFYNNDHPEDFNQNQFLCWWFAWFSSTDDVYCIYALYLIGKHKYKIDDFPGINLEQLKEFSQIAHIRI